jgi:hypothetical protein
MIHNINNHKPHRNNAILSNVILTPKKYKKILTHKYYTSIDKFLQKIINISKTIPWLIPKSPINILELKKYMFIWLLTWHIFMCKIFTMKKRLLIVALLASWMITFTHAQSLWDIELSFCDNNQTDQVDIVTKSNQDTNICVSFQNNSDNDTTLNITFVDGSINKSWWKSCGIPEDPNINFAKYMKDYKSEIFIPAHSQAQEIYTIHFPIWYEWISHWCITYDIKKAEDASEMINFVFRKAFSIDILVWWSQVKPKLEISNIYLSGYDTNQKIVLEIHNKWNIDQDILLTGIIKNRFGYEWKFETSGTIIPANTKTTLVSNEVRIPSYKWFFIVKSYLTNDPIFNFDITKTDLKNEYSTQWLTIIKNTTMLWSRLYITLIILIIVLIIAIIIKSSPKNKQTKIIVKAPKKSKKTTWKSKSKK